MTLQITSQSGMCEARSYRRCEQRMDPSSTSIALPQHPNNILIKFINTSPTRSVYESYPQRQSPTDRPTSETANN